jgi:hypothetical protein
MAGTEWPPQGRFKAIFEQLALEDEQQQQEVVNEAELAELQKGMQNLLKRGSPFRLHKGSIVQRKKNSNKKIR